MPDALGPSDAPAHFTTPPDWVCEILSPRTEAVDRGKKMRIYRREGVGHAWPINPITQTLEVYRLDAGRWILVTPTREKPSCVPSRSTPSSSRSRRSGSAEIAGG